MHSLIKNLAAISAFIITPVAHADMMEYNLEASARSYSAGLSVVPSVAYKFTLWGEEGSPLQGAIRPKLTGDLSPATYSGKIELEFSPVTFVNLSIGKKLMRIYSTFDDDLCKVHKCVGSMDSTEASARALFKFGPIMGSLKFTKVFYDSKDNKSQSMVDPSTYVTLSPTNEVASVAEAIIGTPITDSWAGGVLIQNVEIKKRDGNQNGQYLVALKKNGHTSYIAGFGRFESELKEAKPSVLFNFRYDWQ